MMKISLMRRSNQRARIGLEPLEARNLQSALAGVAAESASAYQTTVWDASDVGPGTAVDVDGFAKIKIDFATDGGDSSTDACGTKASPILF